MVNRAAAAMRLLSVCLATFSALVCAGGLVVLYVLPPGTPLASSDSLIMLGLLVAGVASGTAMLVALKRPTSLLVSRAAALLAVVSAAMSIVDFLTSKRSGLLGVRDVPWLDIVVLFAAVVFWLSPRQTKEGSKEL
jgi:hypothetical protein